MLRNVEQIESELHAKHGKSISVGLAIPNFATVYLVITGKLTAVKEKNGDNEQLFFIVMQADGNYGIRFTPNDVHKLQKIAGRLTVTLSPETLNNF